MIKGSNKYKMIAEMLEGFYTIETLCKRLKINRTKAIYIIHRLRKLGFVRTIYGSEKRRLYYISLKNKQKGISYTERINEISPIQLSSSNPYYIHGRIPSYEETLIYAVKQKDIRYLIASLILFRKISNWSLLYNLAKKEDLVIQIVVLYEVARKVVGKVRKMPKRFFSLARKRKDQHFTYIIKPFSSDDFKDIEKKWKIYIPLNLADLENYRK
jgi:DNA-binding MarR family transcriptional regulator